MDNKNNLKKVCDKTVPCIEDMNENEESIPLFPENIPSKSSGERTFIEPNTLKGGNYLKLEFPELTVPSPDDIFSPDTDTDVPDDTNVNTKDIKIDRTLLLIPTYQLSSFLGTSGSGRLLNTFTLLPGEESNITIRTFSRTASKENTSTSIVDSYSEETESRFLEERKEEDWSLKYREENEVMSAKTGAQGIWGWGTGSASGSWSRDTHTQRTDFTYNLTNTVKNHTQKASSSRNIQVGASSEIQKDESKFESVERKLKNINLDRVLNYKFYQLNQEYHTVLHVVDMQVGYMKKDLDKQLIFEKFSIEDIDTLLEKRIALNYQDDVKKAIQDMLFAFVAFNEDELDISDTSQNENSCENNSDPLEGKLQPVPIIETIIKPDGKEFPRFKKNKVNLIYQTDTKKESFCISGYIVNLTTQILRTDGVRIEPQLGAGGALDAYGKNKQRQEVWSQYLENEWKLALIKREELAQQILGEAVKASKPGDIHKALDKASVFHTLYNCLQDDHSPWDIISVEGMQTNNPIKEE